jgi:methylenetetrahydrofolate--tRNA-(uracil-5-)-methyltransferase
VRKPEDHVGRWRSVDKTNAKRRAITSRALADLEAWAPRPVVGLQTASRSPA